MIHLLVAPDKNLTISGPYKLALKNTRFPEKSLSAIKICQNHVILTSSQFNSKLSCKWALIKAGFPIVRGAWGVPLSNLHFFWNPPHQN